MREGSLIFTAPMVLALLQGRKTQTRRLLGMSSRGHLLGARFTERGTVFTFGDSIPDDPVPVEREYRFAPGDIAWVKETWRPRVEHSHGRDACDCGDISICYAADGEERFFSDSFMVANASEWTIPKAARRGNVSPLYMPRWAARIERKVVSVRAEPLQSISEADAIAEGVEPLLLEDDDRLNPHVLAYAHAWDRLHVDDPWKNNPWVAVIELGSLDPGANR